MMKKNNDDFEMPTEKEIMDYIFIHRTEDFPMDQTLEDFYKKVKEWAKHENKE